MCRNAEKCILHMRRCAKIDELWHMRHNFCICDFGNAIICGKMCDMQIFLRQRLWLRLGVNVDDQLWLRLNPIPIRNCNPSANASPCRNTNPNPNPNRPTTPLLGMLTVNRLTGLAVLKASPVFKLPVWLTVP